MGEWLWDVAPSYLCCTFIHRARRIFLSGNAKLGSLREELKNNSGAQPWSVNWFTNWFDNMFGSWGSWFAQISMKIVMIIAILGIIACCFIPCIRKACLQATVTQMSQTVILLMSSSGTKERTSVIELVELREETSPGTLVKVETASDI